jgi:hypothetical protein
MFFCATGSAGLVVGLASHLVLDMIPHVEPSNLGPGSIADITTLKGFVVWLDFVISWAMIAFLLRKKLIGFDVWTLGIIAGAYLPDVISLGPVVKDVVGPYFVRFTEFHFATHDWWRQWLGVDPNPTNMALGITTTISSLLLSAYVLLRPAKKTEPSFQPSQPAAVPIAD